MSGFCCSFFIVASEAFPNTALQQGETTSTKYMKQFTDGLTAVNTFQIIVFVVNFYQEMKRFLKLFSCTKATDVDRDRNIAMFVQGD